MVLFYKVPSALGAQSSAQDAQNPQKSAACWPGQSRKLITHSARNGFLYTMEPPMARWCLPSPIRRSTGPKASTRGPASRSTIIPPGTFRPMRTSATSIRTSRPRRSVRHCWTATTTGRVPTGTGRGRVSLLAPQHGFAPAVEQNRQDQNWLTCSTVAWLLSPGADMPPHQACAAVGQEQK
jgi:hypothetical protein